MEYSELGDKKRYILTVRPQYFYQCKIYTLLKDGESNERQSNLLFFDRYTFEKSKCFVVKIYRVVLYSRGFLELVLEGISKFKPLFFSLFPSKRKEKKKKVNDVP